MKIRKKQNLLKATVLFTDREAPRSAFWRKYATIKNTLDSGNIHVLTYYGIGGIGKSSLLKKLMEEIAEKNNKIRYVYYDFSLSQDIKSVLCAIKNRLQETYGFMFPLFELALYYYNKRIGEDAKTPEVQELTKKSPVTELVLQVLGEVPLLGSAVKLLELTDKGVALLRTYLRNHKKEVEQLKVLEANEIYQRLPLLFSSDLERNLEDEKEPLIVFLDTYEKLVNEMSLDGAALENDLWLRGEMGLIQNITGVLWVIAGREKLKWERFDAEWKESLEQHLLGELALADGLSFFEAAGVSDSSLRKELYELTGGTPVYLDLCVSQYFRLVESGNIPKREYFGKNNYELVQRFARYMDDSLKDLVYLMACLENWSDELFYDFAPRVLSGFSMTTYEKVKDFSFVSRVDNGSYVVHQIVGDILLENCPTILKEKTFEKGLEFFRNRLENEKAYSDVFASDLLYLIHFAQLLYQNDYELKDWFMETLPPLLKRVKETGRIEIVKEALDKIRKRAEAEKIGILYCVFAMEESKYLYAIGQRRAAFDLAQKAWGLAEGIAGSESLEYVNSLETLSDIEMRVFETVSTALNQMRDVVELREFLQGDTHPDTLHAMFLYGYYLSIVKVKDKNDPLYKKCEEVLSLCEYALDILKKENEKQEKEIAYGEMVYSELLYSLGYEKKSFEILMQIVDKYEKIFGKKHVQYINVQNRLADRLWNMGKQSEALEIRREIYELSHTVNGEYHLRTLKFARRLADIMYLMGQQKEAIDLYRQTMTNYLEIWGEGRVETHRCVRAFSKMLKEAGLTDELLEVDIILQRCEDRGFDDGIEGDGSIVCEVDTKEDFFTKLAKLDEESNAIRDARARMKAYYKQRTGRRWFYTQTEEYRQAQYKIRLYKYREKKYSYDWFLSMGAISQEKHDKKLKKYQQLYEIELEDA